MNKWSNFDPFVNKRSSLNVNPVTQCAPVAYLDPPHQSGGIAMTQVICKQAKLGAAKLVRASAVVAILVVSSGLASTQAAQAAAACPSGLVWAERWEGDTRCVSVSERNLNRKNRGLPAVGTVAKCRPGLVWAEEWEGDTRCVTLSERSVIGPNGGCNDPPEGGNRTLPAAYPLADPLCLIWACYRGKNGPPLAACGLGRSFEIALMAPANSLKSRLAGQKEPRHGAALLRQHY